MSFIVVLIFSSCSNPKQKEQLITKKGSVENLEKIIEKLKDEDQNITPNIALNAILELYKSNNAKTITNEKPIAMYVLYDSDYWNENRTAETFDITFAHQVVEQVNGPLFEYRITLIYNTEPFKGIEAFFLKFRTDTDNLDSFIQSIKNSKGFKKALTHKEQLIELIKEEL